MTPRRSLIVLAVSAVAGACSGAPSLHQGEQRSGPAALTTPFESGTMAGATYTPSTAERALDCKKLKGSMLIIIARLKDSGARPKASAASAVIQSGISSMKGQPNAMDLDAELQRERARLTAFNALLGEKKCPTMDLAKELPPIR